MIYIPQLQLKPKKIKMLKEVFQMTEFIRDRYEIQYYGYPAKCELVNLLTNLIVGYVVPAKDPDRLLKLISKIEQIHTTREKTMFGLRELAYNIKVKKFMEADFITRLGMLGIAIVPSEPKRSEPKANNVVIYLKKDSNLVGDENELYRVFRNEGRLASMTWNFANMII